MVQQTRSFAFGKATVSNYGFWQVFAYFMRRRCLEPFTPAISCGWHWENFYNFVENPIRVVGDAAAGKDRSSWKTVVILSPHTSASRKYLDKNGDQVYKSYRVGFMSGAVMRVCSINLNGSCAVLIGPKTVEFFAVDSGTGEQIRISCHSRRTISDIKTQSGLLMYPLI